MDIKTRRKMTAILRTLQHSPKPLGSQRIAEALLEACFDWARSQSVVIVKLAVVTENLPAIKSYQRMGFVTYGTEPRAIFYDGRYYDEYLMYKDVG